MKIKDQFFKFVCRQLIRPRVKQWLIKQAEAKPYFTLYGDDGNEYMRRGWIVPMFALEKIYTPDDVKPATGRNWYYDVKPWWPFRWRLHWIIRADRDRHFHNHPDDFRTFILEGHYRAKVPRVIGGQLWDDVRWGQTRNYVSGDSYAMRKKDFHLITDVYSTRGPGVLTLFCMGNRQRGSWGFLVGDKVIPWQQYLCTPPDANSSKRYN